MKKRLNECPVCGDELIIKEYECSRCGTQIRGSFENKKDVEGLTGDQFDLIKIFIRCYGNIGEFARILSISRPTAKARIHRLGESLGLKMNDTEKPPVADILDALEKDEISIDEAIVRIKGK